MSPEEIHEHATTLILAHARDVERLSVREHLGDEEVPYTGGDVTAIQDLISTATITVEFPTSTEDADHA